MSTAFLRIVRRSSLPLVIFTFLSTVSFAATADRISGALTSGQTVALRGNVHHKALPQYDQGPVDPALRMGTITLMLSPTAAQQAALKQLVAQQQDPKSSHYHKWITPEQGADRFGLSQADIAKITAWLKSQGFSMISPARARNWVTFSGTAAQVQSALGTEIHHFNVNGEMHIANASAPRIPAGLSGIVTGFRGLDDFQPKARNIRQNAKIRSFYNDAQFGDLGAPGDFATIYDIKALYDLGIDGTGQKLAVAGRTDIYLADLNDFRSGFGLTPITGCSTDANGVVISPCNTTNFQYVLDPNTNDPGVSLNDISEADLDLEWSGAIARGAQIIYVNSTDVFLSYYYAIDNVSTLGESVISLSYGLCEFDDNIAATKDENELTIANAAGITFLNSTGDSGAAECDNPQNSSTGNLAVGGLGVSYPASSPEVTGVGGTAVSYPSGFTSNFWGVTNASDGGTAQNPPLPENAWNDNVELIPLISGSTALSNQQTYGISSTGGGPSNCATQNSTFTTCVAGFPQPAWQTVTVPGQASARFSPDISLTASPNFPGYIFCTPQGAWGGTGTASTCASGITTAIETYTSIVGGTSASTPVFAGIVALLNQYVVQNGFQSTPGLGNINPALYYIATYNPTAMNQVTTGTNIVYCESCTPTGQPTALVCPAGTNNVGSFGYDASVADAATGYNLVTGLGSVNANTLAVAWGDYLTPSTTAITPSSIQIFQGNSENFNVKVTPATATGTVSFFNNGSTTALGTASISAGAGTFTTTALPVGTNSITATYSGILAPSSTAAATTVTVLQPFTIAASAASYPVPQGQSTTATVTVTQIGGFTSSLTFTCSDPAPESTCIGPGSTNATSVSFTIKTTAPITSKNERSNGGGRLFYALFMPGMLGILLTARSRKRAARGMQLLGLIMVLGLSTMWLGSCGGSSSSSNKDPGTTKGTYTITVNATTGGTNAATGSTTFQLVVQ